MKECSSDGCSRSVKARGLCKVCYPRQWRMARLADPAVAELEKAAQRRYKKASYANNPQPARDKARARRSGWCPDLFAETLAAQACCCAICARTLGAGRHTACDHYETLAGGRAKPGTAGAHQTPRALLCLPCNVSLGFYEAPNGQRAAGLRIEQYEAYIARYGG